MVDRYKYWFLKMFLDFFSLLLALWYICNNALMIVILVPVYLRLPLHFQTIPQSHFNRWYFFHIHLWFTVTMFCLMFTAFTCIYKCISEWSKKILFSYAISEVTNHLESHGRDYTRIKIKMINNLNLEMQIVTC